VLPCSTDGSIGEEQHYGRASRRPRVAQPALSRQIQDLEEELGFKLFERLPRGVRLNAAGTLFLEDARRVLQELSEAAVRAGRVASGRSGTLRVGFTENASWRGVVPDSFRRYREKQPDAELQLQPEASLPQRERTIRADGLITSVDRAIVIPSIATDVPGGTMAKYRILTLPKTAGA
jgi:DNA-binding transcriptional LysR family regulator